MEDYDKRFLKKFLKTFAVISGIVFVCAGIGIGLNALFGPDITFAIIAGGIGISFVSFMISVATM